jgi:NADH-quinone oxidoreductase subunit M
MITVFATGGLIVAAIYSLIVIQRAFHGETRQSYDGVADLSRVEMICFIAMMIGLVWMGLYPQSMLGLAESGLLNLGLDMAGEVSR